MEKKQVELRLVEVGEQLAREPAAKCHVIPGSV